MNDVVVAAVVGLFLLKWAVIIGFFLWLANGVGNIFKAASVVANGQLVINPPAPARDPGMLQIEAQAKSNWIDSHPQHPSNPQHAEYVAEELARRKAYERRLVWKAPAPPTPFAAKAAACFFVPVLVGLVIAIVRAQ